MRPADQGLATPAEASRNPSRSIRITPPPARRFAPTRSCRRRLRRRALTRSESPAVGSRAGTPFTCADSTPSRIRTVRSANPATRGSCVTTSTAVPVFAISTSSSITSSAPTSRANPWLVGEDDSRLRDQRRATATRWPCLADSSPGSRSSTRKDPCGSATRAPATGTCVGPRREQQGSAMLDRWQFRHQLPELVTRPKAVRRGCTRWRSVTRSMRCREVHLASVWSRHAGEAVQAASTCRSRSAPSPRRSRLDRWRCWRRAALASSPYRLVQLDARPGPGHRAPPPPESVGATRCGRASAGPPRCGTAGSRRAARPVWTQPCGVPRSAPSSPRDA